MTAGGTWSSGVTLTDTSTAITNLTAGTLYFVRVSAYNTNGYGPATVAAAIPVKLASAPQNLSAQSTSATSALLLWSAPTDRGGVGVDGYTISYWKTSIPATVYSADQNTPTSNFTVTGLQSNQSYTFKVAARTSAGVGAFSATTSVTLVAAPTTITNLRVISVGNATATIGWNDTIGSANYIVETATSAAPNNWYTALTTGTGATSTVLNGLTNGVTYLVRVTNNDGTGQGPTGAIALTPRTKSSADRKSTRLNSSH